MKKKRLFIIMIIGVIIGIASLYQTFAISSNLSGSGDVYTVSFNNDTKVNVPAGGNKTIYYRVKSNNNGTVKYGALYTGDNIVVKIYADSTNSSMDTINYKENKLLKLYVENTGSSDSTATLATVFGYEHGGEIIVPDNYTLITEVYSASNVNTFADYISGLYTNASKTNVINNGITYEYDTTNGLMKDTYNNIRYYGGSPNNYVYFNCDDYSNQSSDTCELWRIIGVFDDKIKIIRNDSIGEYSYDNKGTSTGAETNFGKNNWADARLMKILNSGYDSETGGSLYWNRKSGTCYSGVSVDSTKDCDMSSVGLKNDTTRGLVSETVFSLLGYNDSNIYPNKMYSYERIEGMLYNSSTRAKTWTGKIGLAYPSDYGYAANFNSCSNTLYDYDNSSCYNNNWMYNGGISWLITPYSDDGYNVWYMDYNGKIDSYYRASYEYVVKPVLYLNISVGISNTGSGSSSDPYQISLTSSSPVEPVEPVEPVDPTPSDSVLISKKVTNLYDNASTVSVSDGSNSYLYDTANNLMSDNNDNIRYYGENPNNYIYFNCDDYSNQSSDTCELWRIIGVFDGKVKLVRSESIGRLAWDMDKNINSSLTTYDNNWSTASLNRFLNTTYLNRGSNITYYSGKTGTTETTIDTSSIGIKSSTRELIGISTWYLRGDSSTSIKSLAAYQMERTSGSVYGSNPTEYISSTSSDMGVSKIAIPYSSDYGYAAEFGTSNCQQNFNQYSSSTNDYACKNKNWLGKIITNSYSGYSWLLTPSSSSSGYIWNIYSSGQVSTMNNSYNAFNVTPVLYLDSSVKADSSGDGSSSNPYRLSV